MSECFDRAPLSGCCFRAQCCTVEYVCVARRLGRPELSDLVSFLWFGTHGTSCAKDEDERRSMFLSFVWGWLVCFRHGATQFLPLCIYSWLAVSAVEVVLMDGSASLLVRKLG